MRKIFLLAFSALILNRASIAQEKQETLEGNGKLVTRDVNVSPFDALKASGVYELKLSQGSKETVRIEADENLQDLFQVRNDGSKLIIDMKKLENKNLKTKNKMRVYVTFKKIKELELSTVGNVGSEDQLTFDDLDMENKSVGNLKLSGKAQNAVFKTSGVGSLEAGSFVVQTMNIENSGIGHAEVNAEKDLKVKDSFLGKVKNKGTAQVRGMKKVRV